MKQHIEIIYGPPGTGKTTRLLDIMERELKAGVPPDRIAFCSFTKKAAEEAADRAVERFDLTKKDLVYFRTLHSLAFQACGLRKENVMQVRDYKTIGDHLGVTFSSRFDELNTDGPLTKHKGDQYRFIDAFARARQLDDKKVWESINTVDLNWFEYLRYKDTVNLYKSDRGMMDFTDMLVSRHTTVPVEVLIIDEAQDLSTAQWTFIEPTIKKAKRVYIGGDDDQAIFAWGGADVTKFLSLEGEKTVLTKSYRIPRAVHDLSMGIASQIKHRAEKDYEPRDTQGAVEYWTSVDHLDMSEGTWLLLARNSYLLGELSESVKNAGWAYCVRGKSLINQAHVRAIRAWENHRAGIPLSATDTDLVKEYLPLYCREWPDVIWHEAFTRMHAEDREYYVSLLRRNETLVKTPRINITTIHGSKGGEADNVVLLTDMAYSTWDASSSDPDSEHRVWYVGATRCKENLHIIMPRGRYNYTL